MRFRQMLHSKETMRYVPMNLMNKSCLFLNICKILFHIFILNRNIFAHIGGSTQAMASVSAPNKIMRFM